MNRQELVEQLKETSDYSEKNKILDKDPKVIAYLKNFSKSSLFSFFTNGTLEERFVFKSLMAISQADIVLHIPQELKNVQEKLQKMAKELWEVEFFYKEIGGIVGYHYAVKDLILEQTKKNDVKKKFKFYKPEPLDISNFSPKVYEKAMIGLKHLKDFAMIFPLGGAGDRLGLFDPMSKEPMPAASLLFGGKTLFEGLIRDIEAYEYLYYKTYGKKVITPIAIMTSNEKKNKERILQICEEKKWFGRPKDSFFIFSQISVPVMTKSGDWVVEAFLELTLKPGGHGVLWKVMHDKGVFAWLKKQNRKKAIVRQINNPIAGMDYGILSLMGHGIENNKAFGFASCPREVHAAQGMNILKEEKMNNGYEYCLSNIEYTDFDKWNIVDKPIVENSSYSEFPANTNILFADLCMVQDRVKDCPLPGKIINMKTSYRALNTKGNFVNQIGGRLEVMMQNIADTLVCRKSNKIKKGEQKELKTFLTYNKRRKTISATKRLFVSGGNLLETPEGCFYDFLTNYHDLLQNECHMGMPELYGKERYIKEGPPFVVFMHPAVGPLFSDISKKIQKGKMYPGAELQLEIAEVKLNNVHIDGSCLIYANSVENFSKHLSSQGKCVMHNVVISNKGIDRKAKNIFWKNSIFREESFSLFLEGNARFSAYDVTFNNTHHIVVPDGYHMFAKQVGNVILYSQYPIS